MSAHPPVKDVEAVLLKERPRLRRPGEVIYPLEYNHEMISFDNWNHMFLVSCFRGLSMSPVHPPPAVVLDLGCGGGLWALEAAKQWPNSTIIGFDIKDIQPRLNKQIDPRQENFWQRVTWVHGNLLDGLPFPPDHFDFVRIAGLGLGVPEDEWQYVLEEVARVMKPRAVLEIIEEDLIFPSGPVPKPRPRPPPISVDLPPSLDSMPTGTSSKAPSTISSSSKDAPPWGISFDDPPPLTLHTKQKPSLAPVHEIVFPLTDVPVTSIFPTPLAKRLHTRSLSSQSVADSETEASPHPQDHSRLLSAWDAMLSRRFLSPQLTTVLPFYLSSFFDDVQTHSPLLIKIPSNSRFQSANGYAHRHEHTSSIGSTLFEPEVFALSSSTGRRSGETGEWRNTMPAAAASTSAWAPMHLARAVQTVSACKEAIWDEYKRMYDDDLPPVLNVAGGRSKASSSRETFETDWNTWDNDMQDRIGSRRLLQREFSWSEPDTERPEWRVWRSNLDVKTASSAAMVPPNTHELCRSMRGFVAIKPADPKAGKQAGDAKSTSSQKSAKSEAAKTRANEAAKGNETGKADEGVKANDDAKPANGAKASEAGSSLSPARAASASNPPKPTNGVTKLTNGTTKPANGTANGTATTPSKPAKSPEMSRRATSPTPPKTTSACLKAPVTPSKPASQAAKR